MAGLEDLYREIILDHYRSPRNRGELPSPPAHRVEGFNPLCGDEIVVSLQVEDGVLSDIKIGGSGCSISQSSASLMSAAVKGKPVDEVRELIGTFKAMMSIHEATRIGLDASLLDRALNVDLSGGERKRNETVQLATARPRFAVLDEIDSGLDVDALAAVAHRVREGVGEWGLGVLAITHFRRLLDVLVPDVVHVFVDGRVVATGGAELAMSVDRAGYQAFA